MGNVESFTGKKPPPPKTVLVPPMFERDVRGRSRMAKNAYEYLFSKRNMRWLFADYLGVGPRAALYLCPPADESMSVRAKIGLGDASSMTLRYQPSGPDRPHTFVEVKAKPGAAGQAGVAARACYFDPATGWGAFAIAPLATGSSKLPMTVGVRYSSRDATLGATFAPSVPHGGKDAPASGALTSAWIVSRVKGITVGAKLSPGGQGLPLASPGGVDVSLNEVWGWLARNSSVAVSYTPPAGVIGGAAGRNLFTASVEVVKGAALVTSFHQHLAVTRQVLNPLEKDDVVGITNYVDIGLKLVAPLGVGDSAPVAPEDSTVSGSEAARARSPATTGPLPEGLEPGLNFAVSWQANKNWLVKARLGNTSAAAAVGLRAWFHPSFFLFGNVQYHYGGSSGGGGPSWTRLGDWPLKWGLVLQIENFGAMRYERGSQERRGRALLQRHEATSLDVGNAEGTGRWVVKEAGAEDYNTAVAETDRTADFL